MGKLTKKIIFLQPRIPTYAIFLHCWLCAYETMHWMEAYKQRMSTRCLNGVFRPMIVNIVDRRPQTFAIGVVDKLE